jgi:adenine-specific DNA methylase
VNFIEDESEEKLRGGYYTSPDIARFLCRWALAGGAKAVLEPSCGDGAFLSAIADSRTNERVGVLAFELSEQEAGKARSRAAFDAAVDTSVRCEDFLGWTLANLDRHPPFDAVVGNPPFIRYQYWPAPLQQKAEKLFTLLHLPFTKHTNAWVPFVLASIAMLRGGGRLAMVVPAEIIHIMHAQALRTFLGTTCKRLLLIDPEEIWFEQTLQGACLLLAEKKEHVAQTTEGVAIVRVAGRQFLTRPAEDLFEHAQFINGVTLEGKWTRALLHDPELRLLETLRSHADVRVFEDVAAVDVGIVTGANTYFLVDDETVRRYALQDFAYPMFGRSEHCPGIVYNRAQHRANARAGLPTNFIWLRGRRFHEFPETVQEYIRLGESQGLPLRYKCRVRSPWYEVPSVYSTPLGMLKRCHDLPRLISNRIGAYTTDTAYRIKARSVSPGKLVYSFLNSLTALSAELEGRHYGGGVLELVPTEIERLLIPLPRLKSYALSNLDRAVRAKEAGAMLATQDREVLGALGLEAADRGRLHDAWRRLRGRRQRTGAAEPVSGDARTDPDSPTAPSVTRQTSTA